MIRLYCSRERQWWNSTVFLGIEFELPIIWRMAAATSRMDSRQSVFQPTMEMGFDYTESPGMECDHDPDEYLLP